MKREIIQKKPNDSIYILKVYRVWVDRKKKSVLDFRLFLFSDKSKAT